MIRALRGPPVGRAVSLRGPPAREDLRRHGAAITGRSQRCDRARSATEAFLYRRLETLPETKGRFRLNAELAIPFDGRSRMEVDLLSRDPRVAVELDGPQHMSDPVAYRRDRRKDRLLQENGYLVLRFLAEHVATDLDAVLDALLRVVARGREGPP